MRSVTHFPGDGQATNGYVAQSHDNGKERIEIPILFATRSTRREELVNDVYEWLVRFTHYEASLMNFRRSCTRFPGLGVRQISVTIQYCISLNRLMNVSRFDVILPNLYRPNT